MAWIDNYKTGIFEIDIQHRELYNVIIKFKSSITDSGVNTSEEFVKTLKYLVNYTMFHFASEEDYMKRINYKDIELHKSIHNGFIDKIKDILEKQQTDEPFTAVYLYKFLTEWLKNHIGKEDQKFVEAGGKIKSLKVKINDIEDVIEIILSSLPRIDFMYNDGLITKSDRVKKRATYLKAYYLGFKIDTLSDIYILLKSSTELLEKGYIDTKEDKELKSYIMETVDIDQKLTKEKDQALKDKVENYLKLNNLKY